MHQKDIYKYSLIIIIYRIMSTNSDLSDTYQNREKRKKLKQKTEKKKKTKKKNSVKCYFGVIILPE